MSSRTIRRLYGTTDLPPLEGNSDEEFEPKYTREPNASFSGLVVSSDSEAEQEVPESVEDSVREESERKKKNKNNKRNQRRAKVGNSSKSKDDKELDEIDKSVKEVNALLGSPPPASANMPVKKKKDPLKVLLSVRAKHLDVNNELKKVFGSDSLDDERGKKCRPHNVVKYRRGVIVPIPENRQYVTVGLSMSVLRRDEQSRTYFIFDHNREYQKMHQLFLKMSHEVLPSNDNRKNAYIEGLLKSADYMFWTEEFTAANKLLEQIISYLHYVAHPCFNLTDQSVRLEYIYMENRPFHIAVLKYCHMLTNKACHRTALELAKLLLNLDPTDPLAVIFVIDTIALRAREHQWLIDTIDFWKTERDAEYLFNLQYSYAMAHFHVARNNKSEDFSRADELVQRAMLSYPTIANRLLENCNQDCGNLCSHPFFTLANEDRFPDKIKTAMILHTKLVCWRWREPKVMQWFARNAKELVEKLDTDPVFRKSGEELSQQRRQLYASCPDQIHRHLHVVRPMANLLVEWELPAMSRQVSWDPLPPPDGINRYNYPVASEVDPRYYNNGIFNIFARFIDPGQLNPGERFARRRAGPVAAPRRPRGGDQQNPPSQNIPVLHDIDLLAVDFTSENTNYPESTIQQRTAQENNTPESSTSGSYTRKDKINKSTNGNNSDKCNTYDIKIFVRYDKETQTGYSSDEDSSDEDSYNAIKKTTVSDNIDDENSENGNEDTVSNHENAEIDNSIKENADIDNNATNYHTESENTESGNKSDNVVNEDAENGNTESENVVIENIEGDNAVNESTESYNAEKDNDVKYNTISENSAIDNKENGNNECVKSVNTNTNKAENDNSESDNARAVIANAVIENAVNDNTENGNNESENAAIDNNESDNTVIENAVIDTAITDKAVVNNVFSDNADNVNTESDNSRAVFDNVVISKSENTVKNNTDGDKTKNDTPANQGIESESKKNSGVHQNCVTYYYCDVMNHTNGDQSEDNIPGNQETESESESERDSDNALDENAAINYAVNEFPKSLIAVLENTDGDESEDDLPGNQEKESESESDSDSGVNENAAINYAVNDKTKSIIALFENTDDGDKSEDDIPGSQETESESESESADNNTKNDIAEKDNTESDNTDNDNTDNDDTESVNADDESDNESEDDRPESDAVESDAAESDAAESDAAESDAAESDAAQNNAAGSDAAESDEAESDEEESDDEESDDSDSSYEDSEDSETESVKKARLSRIQICFNRLFLRALNLRENGQYGADKFIMYSPGHNASG